MSVAGDYVKPSDTNVAGATKARTGIFDLPAADDHMKGSQYFLKTYYRDVEYDTSHATDKDRLNSWQEYRHIDGALSTADYYQNLGCDNSLAGLNIPDMTGGPGNPYPPFVADDPTCFSMEPKGAYYERLEQKLSQTMRSMDHPISVMRAIGEGKSLGEAMGEVVLDGPGKGAKEGLMQRYGRLPVDGERVAMRLTTAASGYGYGVGVGYSADAATMPYLPTSRSEHATPMPNGFGLMGVPLSTGFGARSMLPVRMAASESPMRLGAASSASGLKHGFSLESAFDGDILRSTPHGTPRLAHEPRVMEHSTLYVREMPEAEVKHYLRSPGVKSMPHTGPKATGVSSSSGFIMPRPHRAGGPMPTGLYGSY
jgi:hypothetical protein